MIDGGPHKKIKIQGPGQQWDVHQLTNEWEADGDTVKKRKRSLRFRMRSNTTMRIARGHNKITLPKVSK